MNSSKKFDKIYQNKHFKDRFITIKMYKGKYRIYYNGVHWVGLNHTEEGITKGLLGYYEETEWHRKDWKAYKLFINL